MAFEIFPFPQGGHSAFCTMWTLAKFTDVNGATRAVPGSYRHEDFKQFVLEGSLPVEMIAGSVLLYSGSLYHPAGPTSTDRDRIHRPLRPRICGRRCRLDHSRTPDPAGRGRGESISLEEVKASLR